MEILKGINIRNYMFTGSINFNNPNNNHFIEILIYPDTQWKKYGSNKDMWRACSKKVDEDLKKCFEDAAYMFNETVLRSVTIDS